MNLHEYEAYKQKVEEEYKRTLEKAKAERQVKLEAIDIVWNLSRQTDDGEKKPETGEEKVVTVRQAKNVKQKTTQAQIIQQLCSQMSGEITQPMLRELLKREHPDLALKMDPPRISTLLKILHDRGILERMSQAKGASPVIYRVVNHQA